MKKIVFTLRFLFKNSSHFTSNLSLCKYLSTKEKGTTEDEMFGWHLRLHGHKFGQTLGDGEGQGRLASCSPLGHKESDMTEGLNNNNNNNSAYL